MAALTAHSRGATHDRGAGRRNAEAVRALGMRRSLAGRFAEANERHVAENLRAAKRHPASALSPRSSAWFCNRAHSASAPSARDPGRIVRRAP